MYTLLNNRKSSKLDLYLPGRLVASLHYRFTADEMWFVFCESTLPDSPDPHRREVLRRGLELAHSRRLRVRVLCTIAQRLLTESDDGSAKRSVEDCGNGADEDSGALVIEPGAR